MSYYGAGVTDPSGLSRILPDPVDHGRFSSSAGTAGRRIGVLIRRGVGGVLLVFWTAIAFSLLTWSVADPSLTHASSGMVRNWMGPLGAIVSDLLVQMLGLASIIAVLPPAYWAVQLLSQGRLPHFKTKLSFAPFAIVGLAVAWSSLPLVASWPLKHGYGGVIGDLVYGRLSVLLGIINASRSGMAAGVFGFAVGMFALQRSFGLTKADMGALMRRDGWCVAVPGLAKRWTSAPARSPQVAPTLSGLDNLGDLPLPPRYPAHLHMAEMAPPMTYALATPAYVQRPPAVNIHPDQLQAAHPMPVYAPHPHVRAPQHLVQHPVQWSQPAAQFAPQPGSPHRHPGSERDYEIASSRFEEPELDHETLQQSRWIAERFAPAGGQLSTADPLPPAQPEPIVYAPPSMVAPVAMAPPAPAPVFVREPEIVLPVAAAEPHGRSAAVAPGGFFERLATGLRRHEPLTQHYKRPSLNLLKRAPSTGGGDPGHDKATLRQRSQLLLETLSDFGIKGEIVAVRPGPVVTLFEFEPARGTKSARVIGLADDIARSMSARAVRIAVVAGVNAIGIELPNATRESVSLRDLLEADTFRKSEAKLPLALGKSISGEPVVADLTRMPHLLVAGTTGSGKSVGVNAMILSLLYQLPPEECRLILIDPKMLELSVYRDIPHLLTPVVTDPNKAIAALNWAVSEMESRYKRMSALSVRNIEVYNNRVRNAKKRDDLYGGQGAALPTGSGPGDGDLAPMAHIVIVVDEFADLMAVAGKEIEFAVQRLAQMARAAGIHLIMATQRPSVDIITGTIKANFPTRISFRVTSRIDSRTILNEQGAEQLLGQGDMLYAAGTGQIMRVHGPFVSDEEVEQIAAYLRSLGTPNYVDGITDTPDLESAAEVLDEDDLYDRAVALVRADQKASISYLQRRLGIGYNRAADIIERMERDELVGPPNGAGKRELLLLKSAEPTASGTPDAGAS